MAQQKLSKTEYRRNTKGRTRHFFSVWLEDEYLKGKIKQVAAADGRSASGFFNFHIVPKIKEEIDSRWAKLPKHVREALEKEAD